MRKITDTESFIEKSKSIHGDKYDYSKTVYVNSTTRVLIQCKSHGYFHQLPYHHSIGHGCSKCSYGLMGKKKRTTLNEFIKKANHIHENKYDYSKTNYIKDSEKVIIICKIHGSFSQKAGNHLRGKGCPKCADYLRGKERRLKLEEFISKCKSSHGDRYDYSLVKYKNNTTKVKIICKEHGVFEQTPGSHISGNGCFFCGLNKNKENPSGWSVSNWDKSAKRSKNFDSFKVYIIRCWNDYEEFYKVGRTFTTVKQRFSNKKKNMPYNYEIIKEIIFNNARDAHNKEAELKRLNKYFKYLPKIKFEGMHECFYTLKNEK